VLDQVEGSSLRN